MFERQSFLTKEIERIHTNFRKDSSSRKTPEYLHSRSAALDKCWKEFEENHIKLLEFEDDQYEYFSKKIFGHMKDYYIKTKEMVSSYKEPKFPSFSLPTFEEYSYQGEDLLGQQDTNIRALERLINRISIEDLEEKWELQDELKNIQHLWKVIDTTHLRLDNQLKGSNDEYETKFLQTEERYLTIKRELNRKLNSTAHLEQATPKLEVPTFFGKYTQWPTFFDLFVETIHNNKSISKAQKMQHLKGKVKGEAEGLIQHLNISAENYETAWDILTHRYNNPQILFTTQMDIFLNQAPITKQSSYHAFKKLHDTTTQCINSIRNLGIDIATWDPILVHLLSKKLDDETRTDYMESRGSPRDLTSYTEFLHFLENKFMAREPVGKKEKPATSESYKSSSNHPKPYHHNNSSGNTSHFKKYQSNATNNKRFCPVCKQPHNLYQCKRFLAQSADAKMRTISQHNICRNCLYKHYDKLCISTKRCKECNGDHNSIMHDAISTMRGDPLQQTDKPQSQHSPASSDSASTSRNSHNVHHVASENEEVLLTTVALIIRASDGSNMRFRALLDQGSQVSLISENAAQLLGLKRQSYQAAVSGIGSTQKQSRGLVSLDCISIYYDYHFTTEALVVSRVINNLPNTSFKNQTWPHLSHTRLADPDYNISKPIDLLLDASVYSAIIMSGLIKGPVQSPIAQQTKLGWILSGNVKTFACHVATNDVDSISKFWEVEDIHESTSSLSSEDQYCEEFYKASTKRLDSGQYEVALPMKPNFEQEIGASKSKAVAQFIQQEKKMSKNPSLAQGYRKFMHEYEELGHMRQVEQQDHTACYLPHHGVLKLDSTTTALRVVFNASSKMSSGRSLNDLMYNGPNLQQDLHNLILRWRQYKYVVTADVEKMFRAILVRLQDQHLQSILWRSHPRESLQEYNLTTVTYGTRAAPFLAMRTLKQIGIDHAEQHPSAAAALESSFYMDDYMGGSHTIEDAKQLQHGLIAVLKSAGMNLRKWSSNEPQLIETLQPEQINAPFEFKDSESRKTLGLRWIPSSDMFTFDTRIELQDSDKPFTKRQLLSDISKIFDPIGWLSPLTIRAKILFQTTWTAQLTWDEELPANISLEWKRLRDDLRNINIFQIPRYLGQTEKNIQIHAFCDASEKAYACAIYIVTNDHKGKRTSKLVTAKTKVAPINKPITLPRLELLGALLLSQLMEKFLRTLSSEPTEIFAWTDSMVVLGWLHGDLAKWKQFVANRVQKITGIIPASNWHHVRSCDNAADCATRGLSSESLSRDRLWWEGPEWLLQFNSNHSPTTEYQTPTAERKKPIVHTALCQTSCAWIIELLNKFNSLTKVARIVAWVSRYIASLRNKNSRAARSVLTGFEIQSALYLVIKHVQGIDFKEDIHHLKQKGFVRSNSKLSCLRPFLDDHGILRVGGRLEQANITYAAKHPIIISPGSRLAELIIQQAHITTLHGGPRLTLSFIREKYWLISGISSVKKHIRSCVKCRRYSQESYQQHMADLPKPRITPSRPFTNVGIDFTGHVDIKSNKGRGIKTTKGYIAVFVCLATKAVHLELVSDLSTASFLAALRRMCSRRGVPKNIYSDNGTNFVGASRLLKQEYREIIASINPNAISDINNMEIHWHFNAPVWPNAGGLWEAAVKSLKYHLKRVLGHQKLTYEEFTTLLCQIEACLNSRPLCTLTENPDDTYLTPGHFLIGGSMLSRPQTDPDHMSLTIRWQLIQAINKQFWKKWSTEYLQQLQSRTKWRTTKENLKLDDVVIIKEDNIPPGKWAMARVQALHPGPDGCVRVVTLKTANNTIKRPVNKLIPLPVQENSTMRTPSLTGTKGTSHGHRNRSKFSMKTLLTSALLLLMMIISPSIQQSTISYNITSLDSQRNMLFDKVSELQHIKDEWKLIVYYNMSTYWSGFTDLETYVRHLNQVCQRTCLPQSGMPYGAIILQLQHELNDLQHYNSLLRNPNKRYKRGLVNGVGNLAGYLFGVLDDKFAEQYKRDIEEISLNENHLQSLIKNQTLIIESEYSIIRRNEAIMNKQFTSMDKQMKALLKEVNNVQSDTTQGLYLTSSALSAYAVLSTLRRMQQGLIDVITDIYHGRIDTHLLPPEELEAQLIIITREVQDDLNVPLDKSSIKGLYKLLRVFAQVYNDYLIMEIKIPLVTTEKYELDKVIPLQREESGQNYQVISSYPYLAFNLRKDLVLFFTENDLQQCLHANPEKILCSIDKPVYEIREKQSICDVKINDIITPACIYKQSKCENKWIKLRRPNDWLYQCCQQCTVRIFSTRSTEVKTLSGNGIISLCPGCILKGESFKIYSHKNFINHVDYHTEDMLLPQMSVVNEIVNTSIPSVGPFVPEDHHIMWNQLRSEIDDLKQQSTQTISVHDVHQYSVLYLLVGGAILTGLILVVMWIRRRQRQQPTLESRLELAGLQTITNPQPTPRKITESTSTPNLQSIKFDIPLCET